MVVVVVVCVCVGGGTNADESTTFQMVRGSLLTFLFCHQVGTLYLFDLLLLIYHAGRALKSQG